MHSDRARPRGGGTAAPLGAGRTQAEEAQERPKYPRPKEIAEHVALNTEHFDDVLANLAFDAEVTADIDLAQEYGLTAVPALVFADRYLVVGAQPYEVLKQVVEKVLEEG